MTADSTRRSTTVTVDRCICHDVRFEQVLQWARLNDTTDIAAVRATFGCTSSCGMCRQYLVEALHTGESRVSLIMPGEGS